MFAMEPTDYYEFHFTAEESKVYINLKPDLSQLLWLPLQTSDGLQCMGGGLFQQGDLKKADKKASDYTHSQRVFRWRGALAHVEFHPQSEAPAKQRAPGVVIKVVDMSKVGVVAAQGSTGVFLGVVSPPYKNSQGHVKTSACVMHMFPKTSSSERACQACVQANACVFR